MDSDKTELERLRAEHEAIRAEIAQLGVFVGFRKNAQQNPMTVAAIERILAAWRAAEPT